MSSSSNDKDNCSAIREEFRLLIVPLMQKVQREKPPDLILYCARYFEDLLKKREEKVKQENKPTMVLKDGQSENLEGEKGGQCDQKTLIQGSTSLPILTQTDRFSGPPLRETSSWSNPSDSSQRGPRSTDIQFNATDSTDQIGDQPDPNIKFQGEEDDLDKNEKATEKGDKLLSSGDKNSERKHAYFNSEEDKNNNTEKFSTEILNSYPNDILHSPSKSLLSEKVDKDLCTLVSIASNATSLPPTSNNRRKWVKNDADERQEEIKSISDSSSSDSEDSADMYDRFHDDEDRQIVSEKPCIVGTSPNSSFGFIPHIQKLKNRTDSEVVKETVPSKRLVLSFEDVEDLVKSIFQNLRKKLEEDLLAAELDLNQKLKNKLKELNDVEPNDSQSQMPPRKKRSITTFNYSEDFGDEINTKGKDKVINDKITTELKRKNSLAIHNFDHGCRPEKVTQENSIHNDDTLNERADKRLHFTTTEDLHPNPAGKDSNLKDKRKTETQNSQKRSDFATMNGIVNESFSMEDEGRDRAFMKRISFIQQQFENRQHWATEHHNRQRNILSSNKLPASRISTGCSGQFYRYPGRSRYMTPIAPDNRIPNIGEGGDAVPRNKTMCSIGTETNTSRAVDCFANVGANVARVHPIVDNEGLNYWQVSPKIASDCSKEISKSKCTTQCCPAPLIDTSTNGNKNIVQTDTTADDKGPKVEKLQVSVPKHDPAAPKKDPSSEQNLAKNKWQLKENETDVKISKRISNLNPCAPVFSPNSSNSIRKAVDESFINSGSSELITRPNSEQTNDDRESYNLLLTETDVRIDAAAWDGIRSGNSRIQTHSVAPSNVLNGHSSIETNTKCSCDHECSKIQLSEIEQNGSVNSTLLKNKVKNSDFSVMDKKVSDSEEKEDSDTIKQKSFMKMAEGDQIPHDKKVDRPEEKKASALLKQEEPCLNSACGDFVLTENNNSTHTSPENGGGTPTVHSNNVPTSETQTENLSLENPEVNEQTGEEIELNFACLSQSDSSEFYSSDMSEDDFSEENNEL